MSLRTQPEIGRGAEFRLLRESIGLSRAQLGRAVDFSERQIARWESGQAEVREIVFQYMLGLKASRPANVRGRFTFIDLFAGIGGFRLAFESAGGSCVFTSEWDPFCQLTYRANFGEHDLAGDITKVAEHEIPDHDVLLAGFPCQPFSIAGVSKKNALGRKHGFDCETQGTLFFDIERILAKQRPKAFVLENVKNLLSHDRGNTFDVILRTLRDRLGYRVDYRVIDAQGFLPQHRERIFIVGLRPDIEGTFSWSEAAIPDPKRGPRLGTILHPEDGSEALDERYLDAKGRVIDKYVLSDHLWGYLQGYARKHQAKGNGFGFGLVGPDDVARTLSARYFKDGSEILIRRKRGNPRRLTPRECARLMGFDRPSEPPFKIIVSDTQAYRQFGNAVAVPVVEAVAKALAPMISAPPAKAVRERRRVRAAV